jgi:DNA-binding LacI/PurR family transcriptional regulator
MTVTVRDVAKRAGVGLGTVSRVLNNSPLVSAATRERVLEAIAALKFIPNQNARRLSLGKTLTIGVMIPYFTRPSFTPRLSGVERALADTPFDLLIANVDTPERRADCFRNFTQRNRVDGLLVISLPPFQEEIAILKEATIPVVLIDVNDANLRDFYRITVDDCEGGKIATNHLLELGHRRIGIVGDRTENPFNFTSGRDRLVGYRQALTEAGLPFDPTYMREGEHGRKEAREMAHELLALPTPPTAIFATTDTQALGVLEAARERALQVPEQLSVIGYDDIEVAEYLNLTTVRQPLYESGQVGGETLLDLIREPERVIKPSQTTMPTTLVVRGTTARPTPV